MARIGLVLGAGGATGRAYHAGALSALAEEGWDARNAELVVGTSAGSVAAAILRAGVDPRDSAALIAGEPISAEAERILGTAARDLRRSRRPPAPARWRPASPRLLLRALRAPWRVPLGVVAAGVLPEGRESHDTISRVFGPLHGAAWPDRATWIVALRLEDGARVAFGRPGSPAATVADAVGASCAIPGWFAPVTIGGARYVDGGAHSVTNLDLVAGLGLDAVVVVAPLSAIPGAARGVDRAWRGAVRRRLVREAARVRASGTAVVAIEPDAADLDALGSVTEAMDPSRRRDVVLHVRRALRARLREVGVARWSA